MIKAIIGYQNSKHLNSLLIFFIHSQMGAPSTQTDCSQRYGYVYDALGLRIEKHQLDRDDQPYNRTRFVWDDLRMIQETGPNP